METEIVWGEPIPAANGEVKPDWLDDEQDVFCIWSSATEGGPYPASCVNGWGEGFKIRLPADHPHYAATGIDWTKPIEAVRKSDGLVFPVTLGGRDENLLDTYVTNECPNDDETNREWRADGSDWCSQDKWFIRNRTEAPDKWGDPIEVNGVRPEWYRGEQVSWRWPDGAFGVETTRAHEWSQEEWLHVPAIRLPRDHPAYIALAAGFTPWGGGDSAPDDADLLGEALLRAGFILVGDLHEVRWTYEGNEGDIIGYRKRVEGEWADPDDAPKLDKDWFDTAIRSDGSASEWSILTTTPEPATPDDMIADFYQNFGGAVIGTDNPRHLRILDALADVDETTVVVKRMTEHEALDLFNRNSSDFGSYKDDFIDCFKEIGLISPTPLAQFIAANPGVVNDENRAAVELALGWGN